MNVLDEKRSSPEVRRYVQQRIQKMRAAMQRKGVDDHYDPAGERVLFQQF